MANKLPSGKWRGRIVDPRTGKQIAPHKIIGGASTYRTRNDAIHAEVEARNALDDIAERGVTLAEWFETWTTDPNWQRGRGESTRKHYAERCAKFVTEYGDRPVATIGSREVSEWLKGGRNTGTVNSLRTCFADARKPLAGHLIEHNPFEKLGLTKTHGRKNVQPPDEATIARMIETADRITPPSFAAWLETACWSAARPGELDGLQWQDIDFQAEEIHIRRQWNVKLGKITPPKHGSIRTIAMVGRVRDRLLTLPPGTGDQWVFPTLRGRNFTPSTRAFHWQRVRCSVGLEDTALYLCTRHFFGWWALNIAEIKPERIALQLGHIDGGRLVRELYGHPDAAIARREIREASNRLSNVTTLRAA